MMSDISPEELSHLPQRWDDIGFAQTDNKTSSASQLVAGAFRVYFRVTASHLHDVTLRNLPRLAFIVKSRVQSDEGSACFCACSARRDGRASFYLAKGTSGATSESIIFLDIQVNFRVRVQIG